MSNFLPEGKYIDDIQNKSYLRNMASLTEAYNKGVILEARATSCNLNHDLLVDLGMCKGIIPRVEGAIGIDEGTTRDIAIISKVGKPVCFKVIGFNTEGDEIVPILSRKSAQLHCMENYIMSLRCGDIIDARVTHLEPFGCFVDIGCGVASLIPIDCISISRISHPKDRFSSGQYIKVMVKDIDEHHRITLSHKELLGTWEENASFFNSGETVAGVVRSIESYGVFVELLPNLAGLAELKEGVCVGDIASVFIKSLIPEKMKVKLIIVDSFKEDYVPPYPTYFIHGEHMDEWIYSPANSYKEVKTSFPPTI